MAAHLLATPTISDSTWTSEPRLPGEARPDFVRRVLLGKTSRLRPEIPKAESTARRVLRRGYYLLNTDGGNAGDPSGRAAIGALLRTRHQSTVARISKTIGPATHNVAEYRALIEGLRLARRHGVERLRVYIDSELVVNQVNGDAAVRQERLRELHEVASSLVDLFASIRISWVPREWNVEADQLVRDALDTLG